MSIETPGHAARAATRGAFRVVAPFDPAALDAWRRALAEEPTNRLPPRYRALLVAEAAGLADASERFVAAMPAGFLRSQGRIRSQYRRYSALTDRLLDILDLLGHVPKRTADPPPTKVERKRAAYQESEARRLATNARLEAERVKGPAPSAEIRRSESDASEAGALAVTTFSQKSVTDDAI